jgi:hypothetical protein
VSLPIPGMEERAAANSKNANQCLDCDATFGFIFGRRTCTQTFHIFSF